MKLKIAFVASAVVLLFTSATPLDTRAKGNVPPIERTPARPVAAGTGLNVYQKQKLQEYFAGAVASLDTLRLLALQVQFADTAMGGQPGGRPQRRDSLFFANELEHLTDYFRGASRGRLELVWSVTSRLYTLPQGMGYYGNDNVEERRVVEMMETIIDSADADVDFSRYDTFMIIHAGAGQETDWANDSRVQIWSSFYDSGDIDTAFPDSTVRGLVTGDSLDGEPFLVDNFVVAPANASQDYAYVGTLGIWVFGVGSRLGLIPTWDSTPAGFSDSQGAGNFCVMANGLFNDNGYVPSFPCVFNRMIAGWVDPVTVQPEKTAQSLRLHDINTAFGADTTCIKIPITENEYYLVVNRVHDGDFDSLFTFVDADTDLVLDNADSLGGADFDFYMTQLTNPDVVVYSDFYGGYVYGKHTGSGIYIWHIDEDVIRETLTNGFLPNDFVDRKGIDLEEADGVQDLDGDGYVGFVFGSFYDSFRDGDRNATAFGPDTKPNSCSNSGARSGIMVDNISVPGTVMSLTMSLINDYDEIRRRWDAAAPSQPGTPVDLDGAGGLEIVVLADTGRVYVFDYEGNEYDDADMDSTTIDPYITAPGAVWTGPPAFGNLDGNAADIEIVASAEDGKLYAWKSTGVELTDGDGDAQTEGVLYSGLPMAAPPLLVDFNQDGEEDIAIVEKVSDSLRVSFVHPGGVRFIPSGDDFSPLWPVAVRGQFASPLALARIDIGETTGKTGVVFSYVDTVGSTLGICYTPALYTGGTVLIGQPLAPSWTAAFALPGGARPEELLSSAPAVGDIDADGQDEIVFTLPDGRLEIFEADAGVTGAVAPLVVRLRSANPSAPALGDVDLDGALEIAVWDDDFMYLLKSNGRDVTNWPRRIVPLSAGPQPPDAIDRGHESPVIGDLDGDGSIEVLYPLRDGIIYGFERDASPVAGFPRVGPAGVSATPSVAPLAGSGELGLVVVGSIGAIRTIDNVGEEILTSAETALSIQSLPGSDGASRLFWVFYQNDRGRRGMVTEGVALKTAAATLRPATFMIYPNPVAGSEVHARVTLNTRASVRVEIFNLEGERAFEREYKANPNGLIDTPFDEILDVSHLVSGVYFLRLHVKSAGGTESLVKPFAVRR